MNGRYTFFLLVVLLLVLLFRPGGAWSDLKRMWSRRDWILKVLVFGIGVYFLYGLYRLYSQGVFLP